MRKIMLILAAMFAGLASPAMAGEAHNEPVQLTKAVEQVKIMAEDMAEKTDGMNEAQLRAYMSANHEPCEHGDDCMDEHGACTMCAPNQAKANCTDCEELAHADCSDCGTSNCDDCNDCPSGVTCQQSA